MRTSPIVRMIVMGVLLVALNVPLTMMCGVVSERAARRDTVVREVSGDWGGTQFVGGPVLSVPYRYSWTDASGRTHGATSHYHFLPETLTIDGSIEPGERQRSLFTVVVYTARIKLRGQFAAPRLPDGKPAPTCGLTPRTSKRFAPTSIVLTRIGSLPVSVRLMPGRHQPAASLNTGSTR